jgi:hypothetical protein
MRWLDAPFVRPVFEVLLYAFWPLALTLRRPFNTHPPLDGRMCQRARR